MRASSLLPAPTPAEALEPRSPERDTGDRAKKTTAKDSRPRGRGPEAAGTLRRSFAEVPVSIAIRDDDVERAAQTEALLRRLASQLGLPPDRIVIDVGPEAAAAARARGAQGLIDRGVVHLDPEAYDPGTPDGRRLLGHEVAHLAQQQLSPSLTRLRDDSQLALAEAEAESRAVEFASTAVVSPVHVPLARHLVAARAPAEMQANALIATVHMSRSGEIARIFSLLSYGPFDWAIRDNDVAEVLFILASVPMLTARAMAAIIGSKYRRRLFENLSRSHYNMRSQILAVAWAKGQNESWNGIEHKLLLPMKFDTVEDIEAVAIDFVLQHLSEGARKAVMADPARAARLKEIQDRARSGAGEAAVADEVEKTKKDEQAVADARRVHDPMLGGLADDVHETLQKVFLRDKDVLRLLDRIAAECLTTRDPTNKFRALANALRNRSGDYDLDELVDLIRVEWLYVSTTRRKAFVYLVSARPPYKNGQLVFRLLDRPLWKRLWNPITSEDAFLSFLLVKSMPARARSAFFSASDEDLILTELPANILESDGFNLYTGGKDHDDEQSILAQLMDPSLWTREKRDKLDAVIRMARAAGHGEYVFEQSKRREAFHRDKGLAEIVAKYELYDPVVDRNRYSERPLEGHHWYEDGATFLVGFVGAALDFIRKSDNVDLATLAIGGEGLNLAELQDVTDGSLIGARFRRTTARERQLARSEGKLPPNFANARFDLHRGTLDVVIPTVDIEKLSFPIEDFRLSAGPSTAKGVVFRVRYDPRSEQLRSLELTVEQVLLHDLLITLPETMSTVNHAHVTNLRYALEVTDKSLVKSPSGPGKATSWLWNLGSLLGDGILHLARAQKSVGPPKQLTLTFDSAQLRGIAMSSGQFIERIDIGATTIQGGGDAAAYQRALDGSAKRVEARLREETALLNAAETREPGAADTIKHQKAVERLQRQLDGIRREMAAGLPAGSVLDVGAITITGVEGLTDRPIELTDIHGQGRSVTGVIAFLGDSKKLRNMLAGKDNLVTLSANIGKEEAFTLDIGTVTAADVRFAADIPTPDTAQRDLDAFGEHNDADSRPDFAATLEALKERVKYSRIYADFKARGWQNLNENEAKDAGDARRCLLAFEQSRAAVIGALSMEGTALTIDALGRQGVRAEALLVQNIRTFTPGGPVDVTIGEISGTGVDAGAVLKGGLSGLKEWRTTLERADVKARSLSIKDVRKRGVAALEELTLEGEDAKPFEAFLERGAERTTTIGLQSRRVVARGLSMPVYGGLLSTELQRLKRADPQRPDQVKRIATIESMLADLVRVRSAIESAEQALGRARSKQARTAAAAQLAKARQALSDWERRLVVNKLTIEHLNVTLTGLGDLLGENADLGSATKEFSVSAGPGAAEWFKKAEIEGVHTRTTAGEQVVANKLVFGATRGTVAKTETGFKLSGFGMAAVRAQGVSYASSTVSIACAGETTLIDLEIDGEVARKADGQHVMISRLAIASLYADRLSYEDRDKTVGVRWGVLKGVLVEGLSIVLPSDPAAAVSVEGSASIAQVETLLVQAAVAGHRVSASLSSAEPQPGTPVRAISARLAQSGDAEVSLAGLTAAATIAKPRIEPGIDPAALRRMGPHRIEVVAKNLSGTIAKSGDTFTLRNLSIPELTLAKSNWRAGNKLIEIDDRVTLAGVIVDAEASLRAMNGPGGEKELARLFITRLAIPDFDARNVTVSIDAVEEDVARGVAASPPRTLRLERAHISGLTITGFDVLNTRGVVEVEKSISVTNLQARVGTAALGQITTATLSLAAYGKRADAPGKGGSELSATLQGSDGTIIRLGRVDEAVLGLSTVKKVGGGWMPIQKLERASIRGVTTGDVVIRPDSVTVSDIEVESLDLGRALFESFEPRSSIRLESASIPGTVKILNVTARYKTVTAPTSAKPTQVLDEVIVDGISIDRIDARGFEYDGQSIDPATRVRKDVGVRMPEARLIGFNLRRLWADFGRRVIEVNASLKSATVDRFAFALAETLGSRTSSSTLIANVDAAELSVDAIFRPVRVGAAGEATQLTSGAVQISRIGLHQIDATLRETGKLDKKIGVGSRHPLAAGEQPGIEVRGFQQDVTGTTIDAIKGQALVYTDPNIGLTLDIKEASIPAPLQVSSDGRIDLPQAEIDSAYFQIDDVRRLGGGGGRATGAPKASGGGKPGAWISYLDVLDHLNGDIKASVYCRILSAAGRQVRQEVFPVVLKITNGKFDYEETEQTALSFGLDIFVSLEMDNGQLALEFARRNIQTWTPSSDVERAEMERGLVRLKRIVLPDAIRSQILSGREDDSGPGAFMRFYRWAAGGDYPKVETEFMELRNAYADLRLSGPIPLDLPNGRITLGSRKKDAMSGLELWSVTPSQLMWKLNQLNASVEELNIAGSGKLGIGEISIQGVEAASLEFLHGQVMQPRKLEGTINKATVRNLTFEPEKKAGP